MSAEEVPLDLPIVDPSDPYELRTGPFLLAEDGPDGPRLLLRSARQHSNASGSLHGGLLLSMADVLVCWAAVRDSGERAITVSLTANFVAAGQAGEELAGTAEVVRHTRSMSFVNGRIAVGERVLLTCTAVVKRQQRA